MSNDPNFDAIMKYLKLYYPQYFDGDEAVDDDILHALYELSMDSRPQCLSENLQNFAQMWFLAYLISLREETSTGQKQVSVAGPIVSEKEGDITISYADLSKQGYVESERPSSDPYDQWSRLWIRCTRAAIITRYGDPVKSVAMMVTEARQLYSINSIGVC